MIPYSTPPGFVTAPPFATPEPTPSSERALLRTGLIAAGKRARDLGGELGAVVIDLRSGAIGELNGDDSLPMQSVQKLLIAVAAYSAIDRGTLTYESQPYILTMLLGDDNVAAQVLINRLGGIDALNASIRDLGFEKIVAGPDDSGSASPNALARLLGDLVEGKLLRGSSRSALFDTLAKSQAGPALLRAGLPGDAKLAHVTGATNDVGVVSVRGRTMIVVAMLHGARGSESDRDAVIADVARAAISAAPAFP